MIESETDRSQAVLQKKYTWLIELCLVCYNPFSCCDEHACTDQHLEPGGCFSGQRHSL